MRNAGPAGDHEPTGERETAAPTTRVTGVLIVVQRPDIARKGGENPYAVVSVVEFVADVDGIGGDGTVQIVGREQFSTPLYSDDATSVTVDYGGSESSDAWETYSGRTGEWQGVDDTDAVCDVGSDGRVIVRRTVVEVDVVS